MTRPRPGRPKRGTSPGPRWRPGITLSAADRPLVELAAEVDVALGRSEGPPSLADAVAWRALAVMRRDLDLWAEMSELPQELRARARRLLSPDEER